MEKLALISLTLSMSVIFYVVTYFLITWQWPQTLLSVILSIFFIYLFLMEETIQIEQNPLIKSLS